MKTDALIRGLRTMAALKYGMVETELLNEAADRLEELDERIAIMEEGRGDVTSSQIQQETAYPMDLMEHRYTGLLSED